MIPVGCAHLVVDWKRQLGAQREPGKHCREKAGEDKIYLRSSMSQLVGHPVL